MTFNISGSSPVTEYQLLKFSQEVGIYEYTQDLIPIFIDYSIKYSVRVDVAYIMSVIYNNFFINHIVANNLAGIGMQLGRNTLETFSNINDGIKSIFEILQKLTTGSSDTETSNIVKDISIRLDDTNALFKFMNYDNITNFDSNKFNELIKELLRVKKDTYDWDSSQTYLYYIKVKSSTNRSEVAKLKSEISDKKITIYPLTIRLSDTGVYTLDIGYFKNPYDTNIVIRTLRAFGYNGEMQYAEV